MEFSDRLDSKCNTRSSKALREQNRFELEQHQKSLVKMHDFSDKVMTKGEKEMKKQLERLEKAKAKIEHRRSSIVCQDESDLDEGTSVPKKSAQRLGSGKRSEVPPKHSGILAQARSRRELLEKSAVERSDRSSTEISKQGSVEVVKKDAKRDRKMSLAADKREKSSEDARRHSIAVGYGHKVQDNYRLANFLKGIDRPPVSSIVITNVDSSGENLSPRTQQKHSRFKEESIDSLYEMAVKAATVAEEGNKGPNSAAAKKGHIASASSDDKMSQKSTTTLSGSSRMDLAKLKELEHLLREARNFNERRNRDPDFGTRSGAERQQRKRLESLMEILKDLHGKHKPEFTPTEVLNCGYLRLSKSNVKTLEDMIRETGKDPGIHVHSDVTNINIFENLKNERLDVKEKTTPKPQAPQSSRQRFK